jgi:hypothetical protein
MNQGLGEMEAPYHLTAAGNCIYCKYSTSRGLL